MVTVVVGPAGSVLEVRRNQPVPGGSYEIARRLVRDYEFADPAIIQAVWLPESPLEARNMLLQGRFLALRLTGYGNVGAYLSTVAPQPPSMNLVRNISAKKMVASTSAVELCALVRENP